MMADEELGSTKEQEAHVMALNGITRILVSQYLVDGYRYSSLADAMAQVRRSQGHRELARQTGLAGQPLSDGR